jgi:hypothetical protein
LQEYEEELFKTVLYLRNLEKMPVYVDEVKMGFNYLTVNLEAYHISDKKYEAQTLKDNTSQ